MSNSRSSHWFLNITVILKLIAFSLLAIAGYMDLSHSENTVFQDPFFIGAATMVVASFLMLVMNTHINYIHVAMFFFIFTKIVSQITHSKHFTIFGHHR